MYVYVPQPQASKLYNADMLMMMMMSGFVERVINSPQTRYRSAKQMAFRCRANVRGERVAVRRAVPDDWARNRETSHVRRLGVVVRQWKFKSHDATQEDSSAQTN